MIEILSKIHEKDKTINLGKKPLDKPAFNSSMVTQSQPTISQRVKIHQEPTPKHKTIALEDDPDPEPPTPLSGSAALKEGTILVENLNLISNTVVSVEKAA